ncbi:3-hydroxyacyl-CoA dehydrogenase [Aureobasidium pullulans EXF-150]|uniref:3-hydroxyacyl-CoA dehydrogenase n=1 Tax=Aureobasidium pullulans EXF-150 TaxID=1043002 RepID=A0A074XK69_AURPU|nr:3-hydroxyacyl-CoA dehydrogenase [Aureobasidium pullulans EXF-150]KEQ84069.1 3-hydroxyacyl-CoA dehydrogenase [Aureobasidium pullulans EXF-150]
MTQGYNVVIRDITQKQCDEALQYISENVAAFATKATTGRSPGTISATLDLEDALQGAWIVFECVPEILELKIDTFAELERLAPRDCILASNSSSYKSSLSPYIAVKESTGFIFNRIWAAIKRECLMVLAEGVSTPEQLDKAWMEILGCSFGPCMSMDSVGLDTVALIEKHYIKERGLGSEFTVDYLQKQYLDHGKLGMKSDKGGLYPRVQPKVVPAVPTTAAPGPEKGLVVLDMGLGQSLARKGPAEIVYSGRLLEVSLDGKTQRIISKNLPLPDGVDTCDNKLYYTNMGVPSQNDGSVVSVNLDGTGSTTIVPPGTIYTPKQISIDQIAKKLYIADREGCRIWRSNTDGSDLEIIIDTNTLPTERTTPGDIMSQCVGVTVAPRLGKFFWTQKGPSKGNLGRIFSANINFPASCTALDREDICTIADKLPECIDLDYVEASNTLYWTDRGEVPFGNCLYKAQLNDQGRMAEKPQILAQNYNEAIGLKIDAENDVIYVTDLGGSIWRCGMDGSDKRKVLDEQTSCFTGLTLV